MARKINAAGLALVKSFEGLSLKAYFCPAGILTVGYGSTGRHVRPGMVITEAEAEALLRKDLRRFETAVSKATEDVATSSNEFSAMTSLAFNIGIAGFNRSTVLRRHRAGNKMGAGNAFLMWVKAKGVTLKGLERRRHAERKLYMLPDELSAPVTAPEKPAKPKAPDLAPMTPSERDKALRPPAGCLAALLGMFRK